MHPAPGGHMGGESLRLQGQLLEIMKHWEIKMMNILSIQEMDSPKAINWYNRIRNNIISEHPFD